MKLITPWGHGRWRAQLDAFIDDELAAAPRERLEHHLAGCGACQALVAQARLAKAAVAALPAIDAPRSFRLTPAMIAAAAPEPAPRPRGRTVVVQRALVATGSLAAALLAVVLVVDGAGANDQSRTAASGATDSVAVTKAAPAFGSAPAPLSASATAEVAGGTPAAASPTIQTYDAGGADATGREPTATPVLPSAPSTGGATQPTAGTTDDSRNSPALVPDTSIGPRPPATGTTANDNGGFDRDRWLAAGLAAVAALSLAGGAGLWWRGRR
jgi:anti-sigma factor RsiW